MCWKPADAPDRTWRHAWPQFGADNIGHLPELLVAGAGRAATETPTFHESHATIGRQLVGTGGLNCIQCHGIAGRDSTGTPGPDLATVVERLQFDYFRIWLADPKSIREETRMPTFFIDGKSGVTSLLGGEVDAQIAAIWSYLSLGEHLPLPDGLPDPGGFTLAVEDEPIVFRSFMNEVGVRAIACGYPEQVHCAFDATTCTIAAVWEGAFLDAAGAWNNRGGSNTDPERISWTAPATPLLADEHGGIGTPRFRGYRLDAKRRPTLFFDLTFGDVTVRVEVTPKPRRTAAGASMDFVYAIEGPPGYTMLVQDGGGRRLVPPNSQDSLTLDGEGRAEVRVGGDVVMATARRSVIRRLIMAAVAIALAPAARGADDFTYIRRDTREASRRATLAQYQPDLEWTPWRIAGPFDNAGRNKFPIVYEPELDTRPDAAYTGRNGAVVSWETLDGHVDWGKIDLRRYEPDGLNYDSIAYLAREVIADRNVDLVVEMGSDDGLKLWLNGRVLIEADVYRGLNIQDHRVTLPLRKGTNTLLAKVSQGVGGWDFQMRPIVDPTVATRLDYHLDLDFPTPEGRHYRILSLIEPTDCVLEVGGLDALPDGRPVICTRRGEVWVVDDAYGDPPFEASFRRIASGLHEPLGIRWRDDALVVAQRGELTRLVDADGDDVIDAYETVTDAWGVSGNYHEFAFGPKYDGAGRAWVTLNLGFCGGLGKSIVPWRGWAVIVNDDGTITPVCGGLRSPNGIGRNAAGDMFYTDNQGDWVGTNKLAHLDFGDWHGHINGQRWYEEAGMTPPAGESDFKPPAIWFPYGRMGQSASDILLDDTGGAFGPFDGQLFVGDQTISAVMRVSLERIDGVYQGACYPFRRGFDCGVNRMQFGPDGSMLVGMTSRGWGSLGRRPWGLQRLVYTGVAPFEVLEMRAKPDGFEVEFTKALDVESALRPEHYTMTNFTYHRWETYGSPEVERRELAIESIELIDERTIRLRIDGLRERFVHELRLREVLSDEGETLLHPDAYYTLNVIPGSD